MLRYSFGVLLLSLASVLCHPKLEIPGGNGSNVTPPGWTQDAQRAEALEKLRQIVGIPGLAERTRPHVILPQFMTELYNTVVDRDGVKRGENPYNAQIVRSFIGKDSSLPHYYSFNFTGLETNEAVIEAELHLHLEAAPRETGTPAIYPSAYHTIRVYQVLDEHQLDVPDFQKLVNDHRVGAHASGWQTIDVKEAVLSWTSGAPNLGFLVTVSNSFGDGVAANFSRGTERNGKQPILVLFTGNEEENSARKNPVPRQHDQEHEGEEIERRKREATGTENCNLAGAVTSMEIYERAWKREKLSRNMNVAEPPTSDSTPESVGSQRRSKSTSKVSTITAPTPDTAACARRELYVDFKEMGWYDRILAPPGYPAYQCEGHCNYTLKKNSQYSTNHAQVQALVRLLKGADYANEPCCVPIELASISVLYLYDEEHVVLKNFQNMTVKKCGCR